MFKDIKIIGFDADDTLWQNETIFKQSQQKFFKLLKVYADPADISKELFRIEIKNLPLYGYGIKAFTLSLIETAMFVSKGQAGHEIINKIIDLGKTMLEEPVILLDGVEDTLKALSLKYKIVVATKGDLLDQERKIYKSGIGQYLHHIEIMSEKDAKGYLKLLKHLDIPPANFLMIGNSLKSDILPVLEIGAKAIHIPFDITWQHEEVSAPELENKNFATAQKIRDILNFL